MAQTETRDPRLDRAISWALATAATLAFGVGAWQFQTLAGEIRVMRGEVSAVATRVAIVEAAGYGDAIKDLEARVRALEQRRP